MLARNADIVQVGPYDTVLAALGNISGGTTVHEGITVAHHYRIRQTGTITQVKLYLSNKTYLTSFYIRIWRKLGPTNYYLVGASENILASLTAGQTNTVTLASPITNVKEGDYVAYMFEISGGSPFQVLTARTGVPNCNLYYKADATPTTAGYAWEAQSVAAGYAVPIEVGMQAPHVVAIGSSITEGATEHRSYCENLASSPSLSRPDQTWLYYFAAMTNFECVYQNMGISGQTSTQIEARFATDVAAKKPRYAFIQAGLNDIYLGSVTKAQFLANWTSMLNQCVAGSTVPVVGLITPWYDNNGTSAQMRIMDDWNASLSALAATYPAAILVDFKHYIAAFRPSGDAGNYWNLQAVMDCGDKLHLSSRGQWYYGKAHADRLLQPEDRRRAA